MGLARLNIWISGMNDPCSVDDDHKWFVTIYDCDGNILEWCDRKYLLMPARCGHLTTEVPPGVYYISAVWSYSLDRQKYWCNHFTDSAIVHAICDQTTCVKLFNPSLHRCGWIYLRALRQLVDAKVTKPELGRRILEIVERLQELLKDVPVPPKPFELAFGEDIDKEIQKQAKAQRPKKG